MTDVELIVVDACRDEPRESDRKREDVFGNEVAEGPSKQFVKWPDEVKSYNQGSDPRTLKACVGFASANIVNANQVNEWENNGLVYDQEHPKYYWFRFQQYRGRPNTGSALQDHLDFMRLVEKSIEGSVKVSTVEQIRMAINTGYFVLTGCQGGDRGATQKTGVLTLGGSIGHGFILGKDDPEEECFRALNSGGESRGPFNGWFKVPYSMLQVLFTKYAIIDSDSTGKMQNYKYEHDFKKAIELGITNGTDPDKPTTRKESAVMAYRAYKALQK